MRLSKILAKCNRKVLLMVAAGAFVAQIGAGCQPTIRDQLLVGIEASLAGLVNTFLQAFFQTLQSSGATASQPVVQAILHHLPKLA